MTAQFPPPEQQPTQQLPQPPYQPPPTYAEHITPPPPPQPPRKRRRRWTWILLAVGAVVVVLIVVAAVAGRGAGQAPAASPFSRTMPVPSTSMMPPPPPVAAPAPVPSSTTKHFGDAVRFTDGLAVTVAAPQPFTPSDTAAGVTPGQQAATFAVTVTNGSQQNYDPSEFIISVRSGQTEENQIFDTARGLEGSPSTAVLPGQSVTFPVGFTVSDPASVVVQVTPGFQYNAALFTN